jgi:hydroxymethylglutaryl-CoA lyase
MMQGMGIKTGVDLDMLIDVGEFISNFLGRPPASRVARAVLNKRSSKTAYNEAK